LHIGIDCWLPVMSRSLYVMLSLCVCVAVRSIDFFFFFINFVPPIPLELHSILICKIGWWWWYLF
jgi:hypothetical protein